MNISLAPMEGITGHVYRRAHHRAFGHCDRYYTPFLTNLGLSRKEEVEILPENNAGMDVIPQVLTNWADVFLNLARVFQENGYREVNLNIGCPSGTVTAKRRGSGLLKYPQELEQFLEEIFAGSPLPISVKTRIGFESETRCGAAAAFPWSEDPANHVGGGAASPCLNYGKPFGRRQEENLPQFRRKKNWTMCFLRALSIGCAA